MLNHTKTYFLYEGMDAYGQKKSGQVQASSLLIAKATLHQQGIIPQKITQQSRSFFNRENKKVSFADINQFTRQLTTLLESGIPLVHSLDIVEKGQNKNKVRELIQTIKKDLENGSTFAFSLRKHPLYFNTLYCNLIAAGEKSGSLPTLLDQVARYREQMEAIKKNLKKTLSYPLALLVFSLIISTGLLIFVVPQFDSLFKGFGANLPAMTQVLISLSHFFLSYWAFIFATLGGIFYAFVHTKKHSLLFVEGLDKVAIKLPLIGKIVKKAAIARVTRTLSITFAAGLPLVEALHSVRGTAGNMVYIKAINQIKGQVSTGLSLHTAIKETGLFPNMVVQMVTLGEESGTLEKMLSKTADFYEEEVQHFVEIINNLLEPLIMLILGLLIGGLVIAMYLPIFQLGLAI